MKITAVNVCENQKRKFQYLKLLVGACETTIKIRSPYQYKGTEPAELPSHIDLLFDDRLKELEFKKWIVARNRGGLQNQMILFRFAYNNCYELEHRPRMENGKASLEVKLNVLRGKKATGKNKS